MLTNVPLNFTTVTAMLCVTTPLDHTRASARLASLEMVARVVVKVKQCCRPVLTCFLLFSMYIYVTALKNLSDKNEQTVLVSIGKDLGPGHTGRLRPFRKKKRCSAGSSPYRNG